MNIWFWGEIVVWVNIAVVVVVVVVADVEGQQTWRHGRQSEQLTYAGLSSTISTGARFVYIVLSPPPACRVYHNCSNVDRPRRRPRVVLADIVAVAPVVFADIVVPVELLADIGPFADSPAPVPGIGPFADTDPVPGIGTNKL